MEANGPIIRDTLTIFGAERCMFGSNFPVDGLVATFDAIVMGTRAAAAPLGPDDQSKLFFGNACRIYRLEDGPQVLSA